MAEGITGWRLHVGVIFPTPVPPRPIREWYQVVPDGIDITTVSLTIQQLTDDNMEEALKGMERAAKQLLGFDVDVIYQSGVPPIVARGTPGFANEVQQRLEQASDCPASPTWRAVIDAMHTPSPHGRHGDAVPSVHQRPPGEVSCVRADHDAAHNKALGIERNTEIRRLPIPVEYQTARMAFLEAPAGRTASTSPAAAGARSQHRAAGARPRHDGDHLDECHDLGRDRRGKVGRPDRGIGKFLASL